jgi:calcineurin-like phosphoesterase family protein
MSGYDIIGDIHAQADRLRDLLSEMGYRGLNFTHPQGRKIVFLGDFINRGRQNRETIEIVQKILKNGGQAIMGNHEFKAICYSKPGIHGHIRAHTIKNTQEHTVFLDEYPYASDAYNRVIQWFETLPVYIRTPDFSVIHACWNSRALSVCAPHIRKTDATLKPSAYRAYDTESPTDFNQALDTLLRGPRYKLPRGVNYLDGQGYPSKESRLFWWRDKDVRAEDLIDKGDLVSDFLSSTNRKQVRSLVNEFNYTSKHIVFIGHYNLIGDPKIESPKVACLNYKNHLIAYRWNEGDKGLSHDRLVCV